MTPEERQAAFIALVDAGLTFADCLGEYAKRDENPMNNWYRSEAQETWTREGEVEVDENTIVSGSDDHGEYVLAWVWVDAPTCTHCAQWITLVPNGDAPDPWWVDEDGQGNGDDGHAHQV